MVSNRKRVIAITGAARGIGRNIAFAFAAAGDQVFICDRESIGSGEVVQAIQQSGGNASNLVVDLALPGAPQEMIRNIVRKAGRIDVLVNNAQSGARKSLFEETEQTWDAGSNVTIKAAFFAAQEAIKAMRDSGGGAIVNIASMSGIYTTHESPSYHAAKAGMIHMTRYLAAEAGKFGVRVNSVCPAFIVQDEHRERYLSAENADYRNIAEHCHPLGQVGGSDDVANAVIFLTSENAKFITGQSMAIDGGATIQDQFCLLRDYEQGLRIK